MQTIPLPEKIRPKKLKDFVGQEHLVGKNGIITKLLSNQVQPKTGRPLDETNSYFPSLIFWGPPGTGKTTLARIIANELDREFYEFSAVNTKYFIIKSYREQNEENNYCYFNYPTIHFFIHQCRTNTMSRKMQNPVSLNTPQSRWVHNAWRRCGLYVLC